MQVEIFGAIKLKTDANVSSNPGRPCFVKMEVEYHDQEIMDLLDWPTVGAYGRHWTYGGDQMFNESNIHIKLKMDDGDEQHSFGGRSGLKDALDYLRNKGFKARKSERPE